MPIQSGSGAWQFRADTGFVPNGASDYYIGHRSNGNEQIEVVNSGGAIAVVLKINALQGSGNDAYTLTDNINAFKAAYITPLCINVAATPCNLDTDNTITIEYSLHAEDDRFEVKFKDLSTPGKMLNVVRIVRAIWNGMRDNTNIVRSMLKALDPTRDTGGTEPWPQAPTADPPFGDPTLGKGVSTLVDATFPAPGDGLLASQAGNILIMGLNGSPPDEADSLITRWTILEYDGAELDASAFQTILAGALLNRLGISYATISSWITIGKASGHYWVQWFIDDDPTKARLAFKIIDTLKSGIYDYYYALKNAIIREITNN